MLRRVGFGVLWAIPAYLVGAFGGGFLVSLLSSNTHDRSVEAAMTGAFVFGPLTGLIGSSWARFAPLLLFHRSHDTSVTR